MAEITLYVANTSNVKEMKNGRPMNVKVAAELPNCAIVELGEAGEGVLDHVFATERKTLKQAKAGMFVVVAPEIMVEEARKTDGHIGKFRLAKDEVYTAYELNLHDRLELSEAYFTEAGIDHAALKAGDEIAETNLRVVSVRHMATGAIIKPNAAELYTGAQIKMIKVEIIG